MKKLQIDYILFFTSLILIFIGFFFLTVVSIPFSLNFFGTASYFSFAQLRGIMIGLALGIICFFLPINYIKKITPFFFFFSIFLSILVFFPFIGVQRSGASRWINLFGINFQPSELLKLTTILYLSLWFESKLPSKLKKKVPLRKTSRKIREKISCSLKDFLLPFCIILGMVSIILILQPDISTLGVIIAVSCILYFASGTPLWHSILVALLSIGGMAALTLIRIPIFSYRLSRLEVFLNPELDPLGKGFQIRQSLIAIGSGGITGRGIGMSSQKFGFLPHVMSDSIFSVIAEEVGFIGCFILISLFVIILWRGIRIAKLSDNKFFSLVALGITSWIIIQAFINIGALAGILPLTGIPLPFISFGSSHIMVELIAIGILLNISKHA